MNFPLTWDLDRVFSGGSTSSFFQEKLKEIGTKTSELETLLSKKSYEKAIPLCEDIQANLKEMEAFVECLVAQNVTDTKALALVGQVRQLSTRYSNSELTLDALLVELSDNAFDQLIKIFPELNFHLNEKRNRAKDKLPPSDEAFINDFAMDGYHSWWEFWQVRIGEMTFPFQGESLSFGQIENKLSDPDRSIRKEGFDSIQETFSDARRGFAQVANHLGGFRLEMYKKRNWPLLKEALDDNRISIKTLDAMWDAISEIRPNLNTYLKCKSDLLGIDQLSWYDLDAPLDTNTKEINYEEACHLIVKQFQTFSPKMGQFATRALENHWIDAEDRKGKAPGGFCTRLPLIKESRIFMTFSNTMTNLFTLAHELGHAFHNEVLFDLTESAQDARMGVAETASTMAEMIVTQAAIQSESNPKERLLLLDDHLSRATAYLMNIYARFLYETQFYEKRKSGFVSDEELSELMEEAQKEAYGNALQTYHPHFWAAKMHFFFTDVPFYNFPYTFGYLFSLGIYKHAKEKEDFETAYISLLQDTGRMNVEDLAQKHLDRDLSTPDFWREALSIIQKDIETFITLSKEVKL